MSVKAVFLDRDDTITVDPGFVTEPEQVALAAGAPEAMRMLSDAGFLLVCVTNQSGIARGKLTESKLGVIHNELRRQLAQKGAKLDAIYHCPYHVDGTIEEFTRESELRKPAPGMLLKAAKELDIDLAASWMVGDRPADIEAGKRAGCKTIRVLTGKFGQNELNARADFTAANMTEAARIILAQRPKVKHPASTPISRPEPTGEKPAKQNGGEAKQEDKKPYMLLTQHSAPVEPEDKNIPQAPSPDALSDHQLLGEILLQLRQLVRINQHEDFSLTKLIAGIVQGLAIIAFLIGFVQFLSVNDIGQQSQQFWRSMGWLASAAVLQVSALSFYIMGNRC